MRVSLGPLLRPLLFAEAPSDHLLESFRGDVLLMMGVSRDIEVNAAFSKQGLLEQRPYASLVGVILMMAVVIDGLVPEDDPPSIRALVVALTAQSSLRGVHLQAVQIPSDIRIGMKTVDLDPLRKIGNIIVKRGQTPKLAELGIGDPSAERVFSIVVIAQNGPKAKAFDFFEPSIRGFELLVELVQDFLIAVFNAVPRRHLDTVLVNIVAEHQRELAIALPANLVHGAADAVLPGVPSTAISEKEDDEAVSIPEIRSVVSLAAELGRGEKNPQRKPQRSAHRLGF